MARIVVVQYVFLTFFTYTSCIHFGAPAIDVGAEGDRGIDPPVLNSGGKIPRTFQAKLHEKITQHGR